MKADLREVVMLEILEFDKIRREFQIAQEIARRDALRLEILDLDYRFAVTPSLNTPAYLREQNAMDRQRANVWNAWTSLRSQLTHVKLLVLGDENF